MHGWMVQRKKGKQGMGYSSLWRKYPGINRPVVGPQTNNKAEVFGVRVVLQMVHEDMFNYIVSPNGVWTICISFSCIGEENGTQTCMLTSGTAYTACYEFGQGAVSHNEQGKRQVV